MIEDVAVEQDASHTKPLRIISITGGKGGIGKTTISVNLAIAFAKAKKKVLLLDADLSLANVDVMLGLAPKKNLHDFLMGNASLDEICVTGPHGIRVIPAASGIQKMAELSGVESIELIHAISSLEEDIDIMLVDTAAGISQQVINFTQASPNIVVVICNEPASLVDSYAVIKILKQNCARNQFGIVVNKVRDMQEGFHIFDQFQAVVSKFIDIHLNYLGYIPQDDYIQIAARDRVSVVGQFPQSPSAQAFMQLSHGISHWQSNDELAGGIHFFFERLIQNRFADEEDLCKV